MRYWPSGVTWTTPPSKSAISPMAIPLISAGRVSGSGKRETKRIRPSRTAPSSKPNATWPSLGSKTWDEGAFSGKIFRSSRTRPLSKRTILTVPSLKYIHPSARYSSAAMCMGWAWPGRHGGSIPAVFSMSALLNKGMTTMNKNTNTRDTDRIVPNPPREIRIFAALSFISTDRRVTRSRCLPV